MAKLRHFVLRMILVQGSQQNFETAIAALFSAITLKYMTKGMLRAAGELGKELSVFLRYAIKNTSKRLLVIHSRPDTSYSSFINFTL